MKSNCLQADWNNMHLINGPAEPQGCDKCPSCLCSLKWSLPDSWWLAVGKLVLTHRTERRIILQNSAFSAIKLPQVHVSATTHCITHPDPSSSRFVLPDLTRGNKIPPKQKWGCRPDVHLTNQTCGFHLWCCLKIVLIHPSIQLAFSISQPLGLQSKQRCSNLLQLLWEIWRNWPKDKISTACPKI